MKGCLGIVLLLQVYSLQGVNLFDKEAKPLLSKQKYTQLVPIPVSDGCYYVPKNQARKGLLWTRKKEFQATEDLSSGQSVLHKLASLVGGVNKNMRKIDAFENTVTQLRGENEQLSKRVIELEKKVVTIKSEQDLETIQLAFLFPEYGKEQST